METARTAIPISEADLLVFAEFLSKEADEFGKMVFVFGVEGVTGDVDEGGVFPVQVDAIGMKEVRQSFYGADEFGAAFVGGEDVGAGFAAAPAAEGKDDFEVGVFIFQRNHVPDRGRVVGVADIEEVAVEVAEAKNDMG